MIKMLKDYMESGFLENIIDLFKHDKSLYPLIGDMLEDERGRVRVGTVALVEALKTEDFNNVIAAIPGIARLLKNTNPTIQGDAAYLLGIIGHKDALPYLLESSDEKIEIIKETIKDSIKLISH